MPFLFTGRAGHRRRRWTLALGYAALLASCDSPFAPDVQDVGRIEITPPVLTMVVGGNATLTVKVYGPDDVLLPAANVFWSTQDPTVVTVDQSGIVSGVAAGTAQIAASSGGQSRTIAVTVSQKPIALVRITPPASTIAAGQTFQLQGEALDGSGAILPNRLLEWATNAPNIATVDNNGLVTGVTIGQATISAIGEGKVGTSVITVQPTPVSTITVTPNGGSLAAGSTMTFTATPRDANGNALTGRTLQWRSSDDGIATVSAAGLLTAISPGQVTITVSAPNGGPGGSTPSTSVNVTVLIEPVASAVIVPDPASVQVGKTLSLTVNLFDGGGDPLSSAGRNITWNSSNSAIASVNSSGVVTGVATGLATITAVITTPGQTNAVQATVQLSVSSQPVASVSITPASATIHVGYSRQFSALARDNTGQPLPGRPILWTSSNQAIATVDAVTGLVTGVSQGSVQIRATSEGVQGAVAVTVDLVSVSSVVVTPPSATIMPALTVQLSASPRDSAGNVIQGPALGGRTTNWSSANTGVATVNGTGLVTAVAQGTSNVSATIGGTAGQSAITVNPLPSASQLAITTPPSGTVQNDAAFAQQPVIQLKDAQGNNVSTAGVVVQAAIASGGGTLGGTTTATTNASGAATFSGLKITGLVGARTLTFTSGALTPATSGAINVQPGSATQVAITTPPPASANSGQVFSSATLVQLRDVSGNNVPLAGVLVTAAVTPSAGVTLGGGSVTTAASGAATFGALTLTGPAGSYSLTFSSGALTPATSGTITLGAGSGSTLSITTQPPASVPNGQAFGAVIQLRDGSNNPVAQAGVDVQVAINTGAGVLGGTMLATTNASGTATFSNLSITGTVGARTLIFFANAFTSVTSNTINVTAGAAAALSVTTQPSSSAQSGAPFGSQPAVQVVDGSGNAVSQAGIVVTASLNGAGGALIGTTTATTSGAGLATFSGLGISGTAGSYSLSFSAGGLTGALSSGISLSAGAAAQLTITTQPGGASSGAAFNTQPAIQVRDAQGNPVAQSGITVTASIASGGPGTLVGTAQAITNGSGAATFFGLGLSGTVGNYTIGFAAAPLTGATSGTVALAHGAAAQLVILTQPAGATNGAAFSTQPSLQVRDAQGNPVTQAGISVTASPNGGASLFGSGSTTTNGSGVATFSGLGLSGTVGNYTLDFASAGVPNVTSASISLAAGAAAQLVVLTQPGSPVTSGSALSPQPAVQVRDAGGNNVAASGLTISAGISAGGALTGPTTASTDGTGLATFSGLVVSGPAGTYTISFSSGSLTPATSGSVVVQAGAASQLTITTSPGGATSGAAFTTQPSIQIRDAQGNAVSASGVTVNASIASGTGSLIGGSATTNGSGLATFSGLGISGTVGSFTLTFSSGGLTPVTSGSFALAPGAAAILAIQTQPSGATSGAPFSTQPSILVTDAQGNAVNAGVIVSASANGGASLVGSGTATTNASGVATFAGLGLSGLVGNYTVTFAAGAAPSVTSGTIALAAGAAAKLAMSAQPPSSVANGGAFSSSVQIQDAAGNAVSSNGVPVTVALSGSGGALGGTTPVSSASGVAAFTDLTITGLVGNYSLVFSAPGLSGTSSSQVALTAGAAAQLAMASQPSATAIAGSPFANQPAIRLRDASGNNVAQSGVGVSASLNGAGGSLIGTGTATTDGSGVATFSDLGIGGAAGNYTITFSSGGLTSTTSASISVALPAVGLVIGSQPSPTAASGLTFGAQPSIQIVDGANNPVSQPGVQVSVSITGGGATLLGTSTATSNTLGVATFSGLGIAGIVGMYTLTFSAIGLVGTTSSGISVTHGQPSQLVIVLQPGPTASSGAPFSTQPMVQIRDAQGNNVLLSGITVGAAIQTGQPGATIQGNGATTDANGLAAFTSLRLTGLVGSYTIALSASGMSGTTSGSIALGAGVATQITISTQPGGARRNVAFTIQPAIQIRDSAGNPVPQSGIIVTASVFIGGGALSGTLSVATNTVGLASFTNLTLDKTGSHQLSFSAAGLGTVVSNPFAVNP